MTKIYGIVTIEGIYDDYRENETCFYASKVQCDHDLLIYQEVAAKLKGEPNLYFECTGFHSSVQGKEITYMLNKFPELNKLFASFVVENNGKEYPRISRNSFTDPDFSLQVTVYDLV